VRRKDKKVLFTSHPIKKQCKIVQVNRDLYLLLLSKGGELKDAIPLFSKRGFSLSPPSIQTIFAKLPLGNPLKIILNRANKGINRLLPNFSPFQIYKFIFPILSHTFPFPA